MQAGNKSRLEQNARFFSWQEVGKESSLLTGLCIFFGEADGVTLQIICMCFLDSFGPVDGGFLTGPKIKIEKKPFFLKDRAQYCTMNIILHAHLHRTPTTHIIFKLVLQSRKFRLSHHGFNFQIDQLPPGDPFQEAFAVVEEQMNKTKRASRGSEWHGNVGRGKQPAPPPGLEDRVL